MELNFRTSTIIQDHTNNCRVAVRGDQNTIRTVACAI